MKNESIDSTSRSPVYSDRYVYKKQPLMAKETFLLQSSQRRVISKLLITTNEEEPLDYMPIHRLVKPNAAGIFYNVVNLALDDEAELNKASLEPSIQLRDTPHQSYRSAGSNAVIARVRRHQLLNKGYSRISEKGASRNKGSAALDFKLNIADYELVTRNWTSPPLDNASVAVPVDEELVAMEVKEEVEEENRTSLLMLEPLLLVSAETSDMRIKYYEKQRLAHSEQIKLLRIVVAYALTFVVLLSLTFYVVYFA